MFLGIRVTVTTISQWKSLVAYTIIELDIEMLRIVVNSDNVY